MLIVPKSGKGTGNCKGRIKQIDNDVVFRMTQVYMKKLGRRPVQRKPGVKYVYFQNK